MEEFWVKMKNGIKEGAAFSATKIEQYSKIGKLKIEQFGLNKKIEGLQNELGVRLYDMVKEENAATVAEDSVVVEAIAKIDEFKEEIEKLETEIETIREEAAEKAAAEAAEKERKKEEAAKAETAAEEDEALGI